MPTLKDQIKIIFIFSLLANDIPLAENAQNGVVAKFVQHVIRNISKERQSLEQAARVEITEHRNLIEFVRKLFYCLVAKLHIWAEGRV